MIRPDTIGELKDGAAGLIALSELLGSRRVGPKSVARALAEVPEACAVAERAAAPLASDIAAVTRDYPSAAAALFALQEGAVLALNALSTEAEAASRSPVDARSRLVLERVSREAASRVAATLFAVELFACVSAPRPVTVRVADVLTFGPAVADGPNVVRATLDVPPEPLVTIDAKLLRALVELCVQIVAAGGVARPHVSVSGGRTGGARIHITGPPAHQRPGSPILVTRRLPWPAGAGAIAHAAASLVGASAQLDAKGREALLTVP